MRWRPWRALGWTALALGALLLLAPLVSREVRFVYRGAYELARIHWRARAITDLPDDPALATVQAARAFAVDSLGLDAGDSFTRYADVGRDTLVLVLSASRHDTLAPYQWWFPITGRVPYHGYYSLDRAREAEARLAARGYDTYLRPAGAFSTLGWLPDPLLSTALGPVWYLPTTVIHELVHNTIWVPGETAFNESLAELVGLEGALRFHRTRGDTMAARQLRDYWEQQQVRAAVQEALVADLQAAFADGVGPVARERLRVAAFRRAAATLAERNVPPGGTLATAIREHNNAAVIAGGIYRADLADLITALATCGHDLRRLIAAVRAAGDSVPAQVFRLCDPAHGDGQGGRAP